MTTQARAWRAWLVVIAIIVVAGIGGYFVLTATHSTATRASTPTATRTPSPAESAARALHLLVDDPAALVPADQASSVDVATAVPEGSTVKPHPDTWVTTGEDAGTMTVTLTTPGEPTEDYLVAMAKEDGHWKVLTTLAAGQ